MNARPESKKGTFLTDTQSFFRNKPEMTVKDDSSRMLKTTNVKPREEPIEYVEKKERDYERVVQYFTLYRGTLFMIEFSLNHLIQITIKDFQLLLVLTS